MEDPINTLSFIKEIILNKHKDIVGLAVTKGNRLTIGERRSKIIYLLSLLLIMGVLPFIRFAYITLIFKTKKYLSNYFKFISSPSIIEYAKNYKIPTWEISSPNSKLFLDLLVNTNPDVIINQSQSILKKQILSIPSIGVINRHNALLPKNRGRLTPFWVLNNNEKETGVSIHFVEESIDSGDIIVLEKIKVSHHETFSSLVEKCYAIAPKAMLKALIKLETGSCELIHNDDSKATYNTIPTLMEALAFRVKMIKKFFIKN